MSDYSLSFATSLSGDKNPWRFPYNADENVSLSVDGSKVTFKVQLTHLSFLKEVYHPCFVRATLSVNLAPSGVPTESQLKALADALAKRFVSLFFDSAVIGSDYLLLDATPSVSYDGSNLPSSATLSLDIYSRDKLLTLDKFSKAYLSHKLGDDILKGSLDSAKPLGAYKVTESHKNIDHLIGYLDANQKVEVRQPYLVQYQESFYQFLARVANRCGEMLFFEDGQLTLGLRSSDVFEILDKDIAALSLASCPHRPLSKKVAPPFFYNYQKSMADAPKSSDNVIPIQLPKSANNDAATIEFETNNILNPTFSFLWNNIPKSEKPSWITYISVEPSIKPFVRYLHIGVAENKETTNRAVSIAIIANYYVKDGNKMVPKEKTLCTVNVTQTATDAPCADFSSDANKSVSKEALPFVIDFANDELYELIDHLASAPASGSAVANACIKAALTKFFNNQIPFKIFPNIDLLLSLVMTVSETYAKATADANYKRMAHNKEFYSKAKNITFNYNVNEQKKASYNVNEQKKDSAAKDTDPNDPFSPFFTKLADANSNLFAAFYDTVRRYADQAQRGRIRIFLSSLPLSNNNPLAVGNIVTIPSLGPQHYIVIAMRGSSSTALSFDAVPLDSSGFAFPPLYPCSVSPVVKPQPAFIAYNDDCKFGSNDLGRVAVRYPWQPENDLPSPWLRIALPFATNGGACFFKPEVGDEVMIDYIGGNIERPFVVGALFNNRRPKSSSESRYFTNTTGQYIAFQPTRPFLISTFASVIPLFDFITSFISSSAMGDLYGLIKADDYKKLSGKLTLSDRFGFWSISGDTAARNVTVSSTYGTVSISAFTGISFSTPRGDIRVFAKNILIQASNNVVIHSGRAVAADLSTYIPYKAADEPARIALTYAFDPLVKQLAKGIDISLIRTLLQVFIPPVEGSLQVTSHRFLSFEASDSKAFLDPEMVQYFSLSENFAFNQLVDVSNFVDTQLDTIFKLGQEFHEANINKMNIQNHNINNENNIDNKDENEKKVSPLKLSDVQLNRVNQAIDNFAHPSDEDLSNESARNKIERLYLKDFLLKEFGGNHLANNFITYVDLLNNISFKKSIKRYVIYQLLKDYTDEFNITLGDDFSKNENSLFWRDDNRWTTFVNGIMTKTKPKGNVFSSFIKDNYELFKFLLKTSWSTLPSNAFYADTSKSAGRILFSNKIKNSQDQDLVSTWSFDDEGKLVKADTLSDYLFPAFKKFLLSL